MIQMQSILNVADNSGAKKAMCVKVLKSAKSAKIGDLIVVSVKEKVPNSKVKKGSVHYAVIIRSSFGVRRKDGGRLRFNENACVLVDKKGEPIGTRIFGTVARELKSLGYNKIISNSEEVT